MGERDTDRIVDPGGAREGRIEILPIKRPHQFEGDLAWNFPVELAPGEFPGRLAAHMDGEGRRRLMEELLGMGQHRTADHGRHHGCLSLSVSKLSPAPRNNKRYPAVASPAPAPPHPASQPQRKTVPFLPSARPRPPFSPPARCQEA